MGLFWKHVRPRKRQSAEIDVPDTNEPEPPPRDPAKPRWGRPSLCPECHKAGYIDRIDFVNRLMYQHCPNCWADWIITEAETLEDAPAEQAPSEP